MATWYTDVALNQQQNVNFPGFPGLATLTTQPGTQNNPLFEGPDSIFATYTWTGNEAANDIINIAIAAAGVVIRPTGSVSSGLKAPSATLTVSIGDNDLAIGTLLPIPNAGLVAQVAGNGASQSQTAPNWVSGTTYAAGNVVNDPNSTPANMLYTAVAATSGTTAPHSAANTVWMPNNQRYANAINIAAASGNVSFAGGTQLYGGPASQLPSSITPNTVPGNLTANQLANQQYQIQNDCWIQALITTINTAAINAGAVSIFRVSATGSN